MLFASLKSRILEKLKRGNVLTDVSDSQWLRVSYSELIFAITLLRQEILKSKFLIKKKISETNLKSEKPFKIIQTN